MNLFKAILLGSCSYAVLVLMWPGNYSVNDMRFIKTGVGTQFSHDGVRPFQ